MMKMKSPMHNYDYISLTTLQNSELPNIEVVKGYELSNDGKCEKDCSQCGSDRQCKKYEENKKYGNILKLSIWIFFIHMLLL